MALVAFGLTVLYESRLTGVFEQVRYLLSPRGHWDALSARYLFGALGVAAREGIGWLVLVGGIFVPAVLLFGNAFSVREPLLVLWRRRYRQVLGAALYGWAIAHGVMVVPALLVFSAETPRYEAALGVAVLPPIGLQREHIVGRCVRGHDRHPTPARGQLPQDVELHAEIVRHHVKPHRLSAS